MKYSSLAGGNSQMWTLVTVLLSPFWYFPPLFCSSFLTCAHWPIFSLRLKGSRSVTLFLCSSPHKYSTLGLPKFLTGSLQLREAVGLWVSPPCPIIWKLSTTISWANHKAHLIYFPLFRDHWLCYLLSNVWKMFFFISSPFFFFG